MAAIRSVRILLLELIYRLYYFAAVLDIFTKSGGAVPDGTNFFTISIPDGNGYTPRTRKASVASGTSIITLADAANYWSKGSLDAEIKTAWLYAIWSIADSGIVWALGGYSGFTVVPTTTTATDDDFFLLEGSSTYSRVATDRCIAVAKIRYQYDTADTPDHTISDTGENAPQVTWNPKSDYGYSKNLATTVTSGSDITAYSCVNLIVKQSGKYHIQFQAGIRDDAVTLDSGETYIKVGSSTYGSATSVAYGGVRGALEGLATPSTYHYLNAGDTIHGGVAVYAASGNRIIRGDNSLVGATALMFSRAD